MKDSFTPRELNVLLPGFIDENDHLFQAKSINSTNYLIDKLGAKNFKNVINMTNKKPKFNSKRGT